MAQKPDEDRREIEATRLKLAHDIDLLEHRIEEATDWRSTAKKYPLESMLGVFGGSFLFSKLLFSPRMRNEVRQAIRPGRHWSDMKVGLVRPTIGPLITAQVMGRARGGNKNQ